MKSKKRFAASSPSKPPSLPPVFLDRSLGKQIIASRLRQAGIDVHVHDDHFAPDAKDEEWLSVAGERGWIIFTKDSRIRYREIERAALTRAGARAFVLTRSDLRGSEMAEIFVKALPKIARFCNRRQAPFIARISSRGMIEILFRGRRR